MWKTKDLLSLLISLRKDTSIPWYQVQTGALPCRVLYLFRSHSGRALLAFPSGYEEEIIQRGNFSLWTRSWNLWPARDVIKADPESLKTGGLLNKGWETSKLYKKKKLLLTFNFLQEVGNNWTVEILQSLSDPPGRVCWACSPSSSLTSMYWSYDFKQPMVMLLWHGAWIVR